MFPSRGNRRLALSAFGFGELARGGFLSLSYFYKILRLDLAELVVGKCGIRLVPRLRKEIFLELRVLENAPVPRIDLVSQNAQIFSEKRSQVVLIDRGRREPLTKFGF